MGIFDDYDHEVETITATVSDDGTHVSFTFETTDGEVFHVGEHGGMTLDYLEQLMDEHGDHWADYLVDAVAENSYERETT